MRWVNMHLAKRDMSVTSMEVRPRRTLCLLVPCLTSFFFFLFCSQSDLKDGVVLCNLMEIISGKKLPYKWTAAPKNRAQ